MQKYLCRFGSENFWVNFLAFLCISGFSGSFWKSLGDFYIWIFSLFLFLFFLFQAAYGVKAFPAYFTNDLVCSVCFFMPFWLSGL